MVALGEEQLHDHLRYCCSRSESVVTSMPSVDRVAQAAELGRALDLDEASRQAPDVVEAVKLAERRDLDAVLAGDLQDRLVLAGADVLAVDRAA